MNGDYNFDFNFNQPQPQPQVDPYKDIEERIMNKVKYENLSIVALIFGVFGIVTLSFIFQILGLVFANKAKKLSPDGKLQGKAQAGFVCSLIGIILLALFIIIYVVIFAIVFVLAMRTTGSVMIDTMY